MTDNRRFFSLAFLLAALPSIWIGLVLGVSVLATLAKFQVGELPLSLAVAIARATFGWLHIAEAVLLAGAIVLLILTRSRWPLWLAIAVAAVVLALQAGWVVPAFDGRPGLIPMLPLLASGSLHVIFVAAEVAKCLSLLLLALLAFAASSAVGAPAAPATASAS